MLKCGVAISITMYLSDLAYVDFDKERIYILPIGSTECHGPHLPINTDTIIAEYIAQKIEEKFKDEVVILSPLYYTCSLEHTDFSGTIHTDYQLFMRYLWSILKSLKRNFKPKSILLLNAHGGNVDVLNLVSRVWNYASRVKTYHYYIYNERVKVMVREIFGDVPINHGAVVETCIMLSIKPSLVKLDRIRNIYIEGDLRTYRTIEISKLGVVGLLRREDVDASKGEKLLKFIISDLENFIKKLLNT